MPSTRREFWIEKFKCTVCRDARVAAELRSLGWRVVVIWECETKKPEALLQTVRERIVDAPNGSG